MSKKKMNVNDDERDRLQTSSRGIKGHLDKFERVSYYDDVAYLQTYGNALRFNICTGTHFGVHKGSQTFHHYFESL